MADCSAKFVFGLCFLHFCPVSNGWSVILLQRRESDYRVKPRGALFTGKLKYAASQDTFSPEHTLCFQNKHWHNCICSVSSSFPLNYSTFLFCTSLLGPLPTDWICGRHHLLLIPTMGIGRYRLCYITLVTLCLSLLLHSSEFYTDFPTVLLFLGPQSNSLTYPLSDSQTITKSDSYRTSLLKEKVIIIPLLNKV